MDHMISPSRIVVEAIQRDIPDLLPLQISAGVPAEEDTFCALSGEPIAKGDPVIWMRPSDSFTDWQYLTHKTTQHGGMVPVSQSSAALFNGAFLKYQAKINAAVYSSEGSFMLGTDAQRLGFLLNPPEPPFVAYIATTMGQHGAWRAPVTLDRNLIRIGLARTHLTLRMPVVHEAVLRGRSLIEAFNADLPKARKAELVKAAHPYLVLDRKLEKSGHGMLRPAVRQWASLQGRSDDIVFFDSLTEGELWALSVMSKVKQERPERMTIRQKLLQPKSTRD